jgi:hypothetical protein
MALIITGQQFGRWIAQEDQRHTFTTKVTCKCACGTKRKVGVTNLTSGKSTSCGCFAKEKLATVGATRRIHQISPGDRFGRLTVTNADKYAAVESKCDCGNTTVGRASMLYGGKTKSCGCLKAETLRALSKARQTQDGMSEHTLYSTWQRVSTSHLFVHEPWRSSAKCFITDVEQELGPRPAGYWFRCDNEELGYRPGNIRWTQRYTDTGRPNQLTHDQKREIVELVRQGAKKYRVAQQYGVSSSLVSSICKDPRFQ